MILFGFGLLLVALPTTALGRSSDRASNTTTFFDSTGEDPSAPDVTTIVVSNDDAGNIAFQVNINNRPVLTSDMFLLLFVDVDQNAATGDTGSLGAEYAIELDPGVVGLYQWNGSDYVSATSQTSLTYSYVATGATIRVNASEIGNTKAFRFGALAVSGVATDASGKPDFANAHTDAAPDRGRGFFEYAVTITPPPPPPVPSPLPKPKPKPKPPSGAPLSPDKLPTIFGPSKRSRKDPEYSRFATRIAGGPRSVFCWNPSDWDRLAPASKTTIAYGYVEYRSPRQINLSPSVCAALDRIHYHHQSPPITPAIAFGVVTFGARNRSHDGHR